MKKRPAIEYEKKLFKLNLGVDITELAYAEGCSECVGGYKGRIAIHEVLVVTQEIRDAIANGMPKDELRKLVYKNGETTTLLQDGLEKVLQNITTIEEILRLVELDDENTKIVENKDNPQTNQNIFQSNNQTITQIPISQQPVNNMNNNYVNANINNSNNSNSGLEILDV